MVNEFSYPTAPAIENINLPAPPLLKAGQEEKFLKGVSNYLNNVFLAFADIGTAIRNGWLVQDVRLVNLTADTILAGSILTGDLTVGAEESIVINGATNQITVKDNQASPVTRVTIGKLGSGTTQYGVEVKDASGTVRFRTSDVTEIDGAIIKNATITGAKIIDAEITTSKIDDNAVNENKRIDVYTATDTIDFGGASIAQPGIGRQTTTVTHNLGRKVIVTVHYQDFAVAAGAAVIPTVINQTTNAFTVHTNLINIAAGSPYNPPDFTLEANYW